MVSGLFWLMVTFGCGGGHAVHYCALACVGPCQQGRPCQCDGLSCPVWIEIPGKFGTTEYSVRVFISNEKLKKRKVGCWDRPLSEGRTYRRLNSSHEFTFCNDPVCHFCDEDREFYGVAAGDP